MFDNIIMRQTHATDIHTYLLNCFFNFIFKLLCQYYRLIIFFDFIFRNWIVKLLSQEQLESDTQIEKRSTHLAYRQQESKKSKSKKQKMTKPQPIIESDDESSENESENESGKESTDDDLPPVSQTHKRKQKSKNPFIDDAAVESG